MSRVLLTARARADVEDLVRRLAGGGPRAARRALGELFSTMEWLSGQHHDADPADGADGVRLWPLRDALLAWRPGGDAADRPAVLLRVLRRVRDG